MGCCMVLFGGLSAIGVKAGETVIVASTTGKYWPQWGEKEPVSEIIALGAGIVTVGR